MNEESPVRKRRPTKKQISYQDDGRDKKTHKHYDGKSRSNIATCKKEGSPLALVICASGICGCYLYFGIIQERVFAKGHGGPSKAIQDSGSITSFMLVLSCITNVFVSMFWIWASKKLYGGKSTKGVDVKYANEELDSRPLNHLLLLANAFTYFAAMTASNEALMYVSYPTAILAKSSKLIPTMLVGFFLDSKSFSVKEWCGAAFITCGITTFNLLRMSESATGGDLKEGENDSIDGEGGDSAYGLFLLFFSLAMDGLLASCQNSLKSENKGFHMNNKRGHRIPSALECMLWVNAYAIIFMLPLSIWLGHFENGMKLLNFDHNAEIENATTSDSISLPWAILLLNTAAAAGQIFIFFTIQLFSPLMCTTITTTRKFISILLSVWNFGHKFTFLQWLAISMVFGGLYLAIVSKFTERKENDFKVNKVARTTFERHKSVLQ